jgi:hypothetical protein
MLSMTGGDFAMPLASATHVYLPLRGCANRTGRGHIRYTSRTRKSVSSTDECAFASGNHLRDNVVEINHCRIVRSVEVRR